MEEFLHETLPKNDCLIYILILVSLDNFHIINLLKADVIIKIYWKDYSSLNFYNSSNKNVSKIYIRNILNQIE